MYRPATAIALFLSATSVSAQVAPSATTKPVEETQAPEDQATKAEKPPASPSVTAPLNPAAKIAPTPVASAKPPKWDVSAPPGMRTHEIKIDVDEGSWMNVDVSPDGRTIAFDVLGDIYTMPIAGGTPRRIAEGLAFEHQPRFSPDGRRIAFTSDRGGGDNIWVMNVDGGNKQQVTKEDFRLLNRRQEAFHHRPQPRHR